MLWIHGGCYVIGSAAQDDEVCRRFARTLGIVVASVEYRLEPEHPHPAGLDDCAAALNWLTGQPDVDSSRVCHWWSKRRRRADRCVGTADT